MNNNRNNRLPAEKLSPKERALWKIFGPHQAGVSKTYDKVLNQFRRRGFPEIVVLGDVIWRAALDCEKDEFARKRRQLE